MHCHLISLRLCFIYNLKIQTLSNEVISKEIKYVKHLGNKSTMCILVAGVIFLTPSAEAEK